jgi:hypothetical protein
MGKLDNISDEDLRAELKRRDEERQRAREHAEAVKLAAFIEVMNADTKLFQTLFSLLLPDHGRNTCSTEAGSHVNVDRCYRCTVNWLIKNEDWPELLRRLRLSVDN